MAFYRSIFPGRSMAMARLLPLLFGGLAVLTVAPVAILGFLGSRDTTSRLLAENANLAIERLHDRITAHLEPVAAQLGYLAEEIAAGRLDPRDDGAMDQAIRLATAATPQVSAVSFLRPDRSTRKFVRGERRVIAVPDEPASWIDQSLAGAEAETAGRWLPPFWSEAHRQVMLLRRMPVRGPEGFAGVLVGAVSTIELSRLLAASSSGRNHTPFVLLGRDLVLAHPAMANAAWGGTMKDLPRLDQVDDPVLGRMWTAGMNTLTGDGKVRGLEGHWNQGPEGFYGYYYRAVADYGDPPWYVGGHLPSSETRRERWTSFGIAGLGLVAMALAIWLSIVLARRLSRPMLALADEADKVERLDLSKAAPLPPSVIAEVNRASAALERMRVAYGIFATYLPATLMRRLVASGAPALRGESRQVTIMFTDLEGYSDFARGRAAEEVAAYLNEVLSLVGPVIERHGGTIDKYIGDGIMAFWGAPDAMADHAGAACAAARDIALAMRGFNRQRRARGLPACRMRIGLHTASVVVGNIGFAGRIDYTMVGDGVNTAQRLEQLGRGRCDDDEVIVLMSGETMTTLDATARQACEGPVDHENADLGDAYRLVVDGAGRSRLSTAASPRVPASPASP
ncbi:MAG: hypothetical protein JNM89_12805 [Hyphomicrobiaceae bacterium]|nr:hypothetical protein [Hyphomicrobiaceae bacterium]